MKRSRVYLVVALLIISSMQSALGLRLALGMTVGLYSRVTKHIFAGKTLFIKRDDENLLKGFNNIINGNKSRKLLHLTRIKPFPKVTVSYGGPQSNSMLGQG
jgi:hypothetical protein